MPDTSTDEKALETEFDSLAKRAGLDFPASRKLAMLKGLKDIRRMTALMRQPRTAADEPAGSYSILTVTRGL
jgi:hypothetical protein